ncbi:phytochrome B [Actinidia rufa]|uniref:Phytochrome B n=1 Tax=Actinidia rufa TaxID=165716 RepID=A0A7J0GLC1_9ERIC|nr:phytochrome B [Actinidia rufa]
MPSIIAFVNCDGAEIYCQGKNIVSPTEAQIKDIVEWLFALYEDSTSLNTDIWLLQGTVRQPHFVVHREEWLRLISVQKNQKISCYGSILTQQKRSCGAVQNIEDEQRMPPHSSFKAFLEVVKSCSFPWKNP